MTDFQLHPASYKDPAGFIFQHNEKIYRQVNQRYAANYTLLMQSGLYDKLIKKKWLIEHTELNENITGSENWYKTLLPEQLSFISYPYEWSFDMLKDAALLTLKINSLAIQYGMILKDATSFNIQFHHGKPILIDSLSFEKYDEAKPWIAYRQFCESFLFPLYLIHYTKTDAARLLSIYPDGIPASTTAQLLPLKSRFNLGAWMHVYLQRNIQQKNTASKNKEVAFSKKKLLLLIDGLIGNIKKLSSNTDTTTWSNYYSETIISEQYLKEKEKIFNEYLDLAPANSVIDLGANDGHFSRIVMQKAAIVIATDFDSKCVNNFYKEIKQKKISTVLPLVIDFTNPSPGIGFENNERSSFFQRTKMDLLLALAVIHHLAISKNIPLLNIAASFSKMADQAIIEFVPKEDEKVQELLKNREDIYNEYSEDNFINIFSRYYHIIKKTSIPGTLRVLYLCKRK